MKQTKLLLLMLFFASSSIFSQDLVYKPISPFFGGDSFAYQQIIASATAQNDFTEDNNNRGNQPSELENFTESLNRRLLSSLSQSLFQQQLGNTDLTVGTYTFGDLVVEVTPGSDGLIVNILNTSTGEQTQIIIPNNG